MESPLGLSPNADLLGRVGMDKIEKKKLEELQKKIGYKFKNLEWLQKAVTHKSFVNEKRMGHEEHNERLEFLGDAVLELCVSQFLMQRFPDYTEGQLSKMRAAIVNEKQLADLAREMDLGDFLYLGKGEEQTNGRTKNSLLADAFEAVLGAIYSDRGFEKAFNVIEAKYTHLLDKEHPHAFLKDYKTTLQEKCQSLFKSIPRYRLVKEEGPDHEKRFEIELSIRQEVMGVGVGRSKKDAEQEAASQALLKLEQKES